MFVEVVPTLTDIARDAVVRLRTLAPDLDFSLTSNGIEVSGESLAGREREICRLIEQTLYQQRVYRETLDIRERIYNG